METAPYLAAHPTTSLYADLIQNLLEAKILEYGNFTLKSGAQSSVYVDLRKAISFPAILRKLAHALSREMKQMKWTCDCLCPVPYGALPLATCLSVSYDIPMIIQRKERKTHGKGNILEGIIRPTMSCIVIEDITTTGESALETVEILKSEGLHIEGVLVFLDRQQGAKEMFEKANVNFHHVLTLSQLTNA
jgi:uridine monophosphate synthetase